MALAEPGNEGWSRWLTALLRHAAEPAHVAPDTEAQDEAAGAAGLFWAVARELAMPVLLHQVEQALAEIEMIGIEALAADLGRLIAIVRRRVHELPAAVRRQLLRRLPWLMVAFAGTVLLVCTAAGSPGLVAVATELLRPSLTPLLLINKPWWVVELALSLAYLPCKLAQAGRIDGACIARLLGIQNPRQNPAQQQQQQCQQQQAQQQVQQQAQKAAAERAMLDEMLDFVMGR